MINLAVGLEVAAGFALLFAEFLEETRQDVQEKSAHELLALSRRRPGCSLVGLYGIATSRNLIHLIVCLAVVQSATYVLLLSVGYRRGAGPADLL